MKKFLLNLLNRGFFTIGLAVGGGLLAMVGIVQVYDYIWGEPAPEATIDNPVERALSGGDMKGPTQILNIRRVPGPFLSSDKENVIGFIFLDVAIEISGEEQFQAASDQIDQLIQRFSTRLKTEGVGRTDLPGEVDYERLAKTFLTVARDEVSLRGIKTVKVKEAEGTG